MTEDVHLPQPRYNFFRLLWGMVRRPRSTLEYLRETGGKSWMIMALLSVLTAVLLVVVIAPISAQIALETFQAQIESQPGIAAQGLDTETEERISQFTSNPMITVVMPSVAGLASMFLGWLIWAGALHLLSVMVGGDSHFGMMWRAVVWSSIPFALRNLLQMIYVQSTGELIANPGLSGLVSQERSVSEMIAAPPSAGWLALQTLLAQIDLFTIWNLVLLVMSVMVMSRLARRKAILITVGVWSGLIVLRVLFAIIPTWFASGFS